MRRWGTKIDVLRLNTSAPQYQLRIRNGNDSPEVADEDFKFEPPDEAKEVELSVI